MGRSLTSCLAYGIKLPEFITSGYSIIEEAEEKLQEKHGFPKYFHRCVERPSKDEFKNHEDYTNHVDELEQEW